jgi:hypothetical protein
MIPDAWVYVAIRPDNHSALQPYTWYKRFLVEGAREHFLLPSYIAELETIVAIEDPDRRRDRQKRELTCRADP